MQSGMKIPHMEGQFSPGRKCKSIPLFLKVRTTVKGILAPGPVYCVTPLSFPPKVVPSSNHGVSSALLLLLLALVLRVDCA